VISRLQVQGGRDGVVSVELMVLEQELARVHEARSKRRGFSPVAAARPLDRTRVMSIVLIEEYHGGSIKRRVSWEGSVMGVMEGEGGRAGPRGVLYFSWT